MQSEVLSKPKKPDWRLLKFLRLHLCVGVAAGWTFVGLLFWFDVGGIGSLIASSGVAVLATVMLLIVFAITWGSLSMGTAIFLMPKKKDDDGPPRGRKTPVLAAKLAPAVLPARRRS